MAEIAEYTEENIKTLEGVEHIRLRPGMYIGKLGDGSHSDDGIYVLIKEVIDNSIDEFRMGAGKVIDVTVKDGKVRVRDYGRGIPLGKLLDCVSILNTGAKYDSKVFKKSVGLNGVGTKAVNALSWKFSAQSFRNGETRRIEFKQGVLASDTNVIQDESKSQNGTLIEFEPDSSKGLFENYAFHDDFIETMMRNYSYLNTGLTINYNGQKFNSKNGLLDLLTETFAKDQIEPLYPIIHLKGDDIEIALTHTEQNGEDYFSFVNGQHTIQGGTHQAAYREAIGRTIKEFFNKNQELADIRNGVVGAIALNVEEPVFESQTKVKLGSRDMAPTEGSISVNKFVNDFVKQELDDYLHKHPEITEVMAKKIQDSEKERKAIDVVRNKAMTKRASLHNRKLRDCRIHYNTNHELRDETCIFITEGDSASGSITKSRNAATQAVFSLRGKPLNAYKKKQKDIYENEELNLLQAALDIEGSLENLRYNKVIIATDADVDGMHIRMLLVSFFLMYCPNLIREGHVYILQTPLFRVRNKKITKYCYSDEERLAALKAISDPEITRFKGLGEISPDEFSVFIGKDIRLEPVVIDHDTQINDILSFYMGDNTPERQNFIIENLRIDTDELR
ncbi:MAG: type IIA DNA topoisomerase subunit B [Bacteroidales bacterium]|nr:type IIA DNA topoisomerase subunit B [Bacteroidales bacterium]MBP5723109.1 type IIA DNA topoisomerase subunit B [Bacteroidales bacterium]MBQ3677634.1 type IIA DNA topoisomerase subunit B [Bacteroidales bacterium]MBR4497538.1 type IIA DNA topoisomerase subunit B [Bacteroidales bacterium]MBR4688874.1 type IIA DNA topoisomerase subunit B [Bacteroidales bacterium]